MFGHAFDGVLDHLLELFALQGLAGHGVGGGHQVDEAAALLVTVNRSLEGVGGAASLGSHEVAALVGGDRKEPRAEAAGGVELIGGLVNLEEGFLKDVFGGGPVAEEADEEVEQLALVAFDQRGEACAVA